MTPSHQELIERLRQGYEAFNRGDYEAAMEWVHPDVVFVSPTALTKLQGAEAFRAFMEPDAFESQVTELGEIEIEGNRALVHGRTRARGAGSGIEMEVETWAVWTFDDDGRVTRIETHLEHEEDQARRAFRDD